MIFKGNFSPKEKIETLQRWILVQSCVYYELNENVASDYAYDQNAKELFELKNTYPEDYKASRYFVCFEHFEEGCTSGFDMLRILMIKDPALYVRIVEDAKIALENYKRFMLRR